MAPRTRTKPALVQEPQAESPKGVRGTDWIHPTGQKPEKIAILGLGPSKEGFFNQLVQHAGTWRDEYDEIWGINTAVKFVAADLFFIMDDMDLYTRHAPAYHEACAKCTKPIISNDQLYTDFPTSMSYPVAQVLGHFDGGYGYFLHSSLPWIIAYAIWLGVKKIGLWGIDYSLPDVPHVQREKGRICAEFWLGVAVGQGIRLHMPHNTTILDRVLFPGARPYGYLKPPNLTVNGTPVWL